MSTLVPHLINFFLNYGYLAVLISLILCGFGLPIPEDIILVLGGVICAFTYGETGALNVHLMFFIAFSGVIGGDFVLFMLGRILGERVTRIIILRSIITPARYEKIQHQLVRFGDWVLFFGRFLPGLRAPLFLLAGISRKVHWWKFLLMDGFAAIISVPVLVYLGYLFANELDSVLMWLKKSQIVLLIIIAIIVIIGIAIHFFLKKRAKNNAKH